MNGNTIHQPCSPDLDPSDFYRPTTKTFPHRKSILEEVKASVDEYFGGLEELHICDVIMAVEYCWISGKT